MAVKCLLRKYVSERRRINSEQYMLPFVAKHETYNLNQCADCIESHDTRENGAFNNNT